MIIFSVYQSNKSEAENIVNTVNAYQLLGSKGTEIIRGVYKNQKETSFITVNIELAKKLVKLYNQECYLEQGHKGYWYLIDTKTDKVIDQYKSISETKYSELSKLESYTVFNNKYYTGKYY